MDIKVIKNTIVNFDRIKVFLFLSQISSAIISILIGKIIAVNFLPQEFGQYNIVMATYTFFFSLLISPFLQYLKTITNTLEFKRYFKSNFNLITLLLTFAMIVFWIVMKIYATISVNIFTIFMFLFPVNFLYNLILDFWNVKGEFKKVSILTLSNVLVGLLALVISVFWLKNFINSLILLWLIQFLGFLIATFLYIKKYPFPYKKEQKNSFKNYAKKFLVYAWPLIILAFWNWINSYLDRYLIEYYLSYNEVGIYNANISLGSKIFLMINPFFLSLLTPIAFNENLDLKKKKISIKKYAFAYLSLGIFLLFILYFGYETIGKILLSLNYSNGFHIIFWSALAYFLITFAYLFELIFYVQKSTKIVLGSNVAGALIGVLLNVVFIPKWGLEGAVFAMVISSCIRFFVVFFFYKRL